MKNLTKITKNFMRITLNSILQPDTNFVHKPREPSIMLSQFKCETIPSTTINQQARSFWIDSWITSWTVHYWLFLAGRCEVDRSTPIRLSKRCNNSFQLRNSRFRKKSYGSLHRVLWLERVFFAKGPTHPSLSG